jgi:hypothetical protein
VAVLPDPFSVGLADELRFYGWRPTGEPGSGAGYPAPSGGCVESTVGSHPYPGCPMFWHLTPAPGAQPPGRRAPEAPAGCQVFHPDPRGVAPGLVHPAAPVRIRCVVCPCSD